MSHPSGKTDAEKRAEASAAANRTKDVITDLRDGKAPPNEFLVDGIDRAKITLEERKADPRVTPAGHKFIDDTKEVLDATREFITTKNAGGELQTVLEGATHEAKLKAKSSRPKDPASKSASRAKAKTNARKLGGFIKLLATDSEFRSLIGDLVNYAGEMFNPGYKERMRSADLSSDPRIAIREVKEMHKAEHERAAASDKVPDSDEVEEKLNAVMIKLSKNPAFLDASRALLGAIRRMYDRVGRTSYGVRYYPETYSRTTYATTAVPAVTTVPAVPAVHISTDPYKTTVAVPTATTVPAVSVTSDPVKTTVAVPAAVPATTFTSVPVVKPAVIVKESGSAEISTKGKAAVDAGKRLIENITNDYSLDAIIQAAKDLGVRINNDPEARRWAKDFYYHLEEMLERPELFGDMTYRETNMRPLFRRGKDVLKKYEFSREMDIIIAESNNMFTSFKDDVVVSRLQTSLQTLASDLFTRDERGRPHFNESAMEQVRTVIIPLLAEQLKFIGIPRIEVHDESMDAWFDNLAVSFYELLPSQLKVKTASNTKINLKDLEMKLEGFLKIVLEDIKLNLKDVKFSIDRHKTPKIKSEGTVDIATKGKDGLKIVVRFGIKIPEGKSVPELQSAIVDVVYMPGIKIHFHKDADHHGMLNFGTSIASSTVKNRVKTAIQDKMTEMFNGLREKLNTVIANSPMMASGAAKMDSAKAAVKGTDFHKHMVKENEKTSM